MAVVIHVGNCLDILPTLQAESVNTCVTSPPYFGLRDYGCAGQIGLEPTPDEFVSAMVSVFREVRRVLREDGTLWLNLGDSYAGYHGNKNATYEAAASNKAGYFENQRASSVGMGGLKQKDLIGIPWRVAFALQADGWYLRQDIIWSKPNPMPESVTDRCTKAHEYIFMLSKSSRYYYDQEAIKEPMASSSEWRLSQNVEGQEGSDRVPGKTNGKMKAVGGDKQRGHSRRHAGFNDRWDKMTKEQQCSGMRNKRSVWSVPTMPFREAHFATFPERLIEPCILAGAPVGGVVLDPFMGAGTTAVVARRFGREYVGCELNPKYAEIAENRIGGTSLGLLLEVVA